MSAALAGKFFTTGSPWEALGGFMEPHETTWNHTENWPKGQMCKLHSPSSLCFFMKHAVFYKAARDTFSASSCSDAVIIFDSRIFAACQGTSHLFSGTSASPISKKGNEWHSHRIHMLFDNRPFRLNWQNWFLGEGTTSMLQSERFEIDVLILRVMVEILFANIGPWRSSIFFVSFIFFNFIFIDFFFFFFSTKKHLVLGYSLLTMFLEFQVNIKDT